MSGIAERAAAGPRVRRRGLDLVWRDGILATATWLLAAAVTSALPDVVPWGSTMLLAELLAAGAILMAALSLTVQRLGRVGAALVRGGPWLIALGLIFAVWELSTAKTG